VAVAIAIAIAIATARPLVSKRPITLAVKRVVLMSRRGQLTETAALPGATNRLLRFENKLDRAS
jgi:hypothetical protein